MKSSRISVPTYQNVDSQDSALNAGGSSFYDRQYRNYNDNLDDADIELVMNGVDDDGHSPISKSAMDQVHNSDLDVDTDLPIVDTVALEYDMGISKETKLCSRWCRRSFCIYRFYCCGYTCGTCCKRPTEEIGDGLEDKPSNEELLSIAFVSFFAFTVCEFVAAYIANSEAMMGDAIAMTVDAFTYGFNLIAERMKHRPHVQLPWLKNDFNNIQSNMCTQQDIERRNARAKRKQTLVLELVPPLISVITLIAVTSFILHQSISVLISEARQTSNSSQSKPNMNIMLAFSCLNLLVDIVNIMFFSKADHAFGYETFDDEDEEFLQVESSGDFIDNHGNQNGHNLEAGQESKEDDVGLGKVNRSRSRSSDAQLLANGFSSSSTPEKDKRQTSPKAKGAKEQITDSLKHIIRKRKIIKGGAYVTVGTYDAEDNFDYDYDDDDYEDDDDQCLHGAVSNDSYDTAHSTEMSKLSPISGKNKTRQPMKTSHGDDISNQLDDPSKFSIDGDDDFENDDEVHDYGEYLRQPKQIMEEDADAEHQMSEYRGLNGKANLNMVRSVVSIDMCVNSSFFPLCRPVYILNHHLKDFENFH